jgi:hypothetical protein
MWTESGTLTDTVKNDTEISLHKARQMAVNVTNKTLSYFSADQIYTF